MSDIKFLGAMFGVCHINTADEFYEFLVLSKDKQYKEGLDKIVIKNKQHNSIVFDLNKLKNNSGYSCKISTNQTMFNLWSYPSYITGVIEYNENGNVIIAIKYQIHNVSGAERVPSFFNAVHPYYTITNYTDNEETT